MKSLEIPQDVAEQALAALEKAYKLMNERRFTLGNDFADEIGEAFANLGGAIQDAEATEP